MTDADADADGQSDPDRQPDRDQTETRTVTETQIVTVTPDAVTVTVTPDPVTVTRTETETVTVTVDSEAASPTSQRRAPCRPAVLTAAAIPADDGGIRAGRFVMRERLPLVLSASALLVAVFGATPVGHAAGRVIHAVPPFAKRATFAKFAGSADNAKRLGGHKASTSPKAGDIPVVGANGKLPVSIGADRPAGAVGLRGFARAGGAAGSQGCHRVSRHPGAARATGTTGTTGTNRAKPGLRQLRRPGADVQSRTDEDDGDRHSAARFLHPACQREVQPGRSAAVSPQQEHFARRRDSVRGTPNSPCW